MERKMFWALNALGCAALIAALAGGFMVYQMIQPKPIPKEWAELNQLLEERWQNRSFVLLPPEKKEDFIAKDVAAIKVIENHINGFMLKSFKGSCGLTRCEYIKAIAEALVKNTKSHEEAFWLCGMMQSESSFRLGARPGKSTNSSARGLLQVITRYHGDVLNPAGISKTDLETDIERSVLGGVLVFHKYRYPKRGPARTLPEATRRYRSLSASAEEQRIYREAASSVCEKLKADLKKEVKKQK